MRESKSDEQLAVSKRIRRGVARRMRRLLGAREDGVTEQAKTVELQMVWPSSRLTEWPRWAAPEGYALRTYQAGDELEFFCLMDSAGYKGWNMREFQSWLQKVVPGGFFFVVHRETGKMVATAMGCQNPAPLHPFGATLSCVAADPAHKGKGMGYVVSAAVTCRLLQAGYQEIYMQTDDWRLPALKTYLKMGWVPFLFQEDMPERWQAVCQVLRWPYTPQVWPTVSSHANGK